MRMITTTIAAVLLTMNINAQYIDEPTVLTRQESKLINDFCRDFKEAINEGSKDKLEKVLNFPFYCRPCIADTTLRHNNGISIKVTRKLFYSNIYKLFFSEEIKSLVNRKQGFDSQMFSRTSDSKNRPVAFMFPYTIIPPSKQWDGLQGFIFIEKIKGVYKVDAIDTVP